MRLHFLVPDGIDDPQRPTGGNRYDRRLALELAALGWDVVELPVGRDRLNDVLAAVPDGGVVLVDALLVTTAAPVLVPAARRTRLVLLVHMLFGEVAALRAADLIVTTSRWTRDQLLALDVVPQQRICVAEPGVDPAAHSPGTPTGGALLCVGAVAPHKGQDVLLEALARIPELAWRCTCVGALDRDPAYVRCLRNHHSAARVDFVGPRTGRALDRTYATSDLLVLPSRAEAYGMVVTEALARGIPVVAAAVGGVPDALGTSAQGHRPGILVAPDDAAALATALRAWLSDAELRRGLRAAASARRTQLTGWAATARKVAAALAATDPPAG